jgi:hypothetical protein
VAKTQSVGRSMSRPGHGWIAFAAVILILVGTLNIIEGISAISGANYLVNQLLFANLSAWGWFFLIWGIIQVLAGFAILGGATWAVFVGIATAFLNLIAQFSWSRVYPVWALTAMVADVLVIYGLLVHGFGQDADR